MSKAVPDDQEDVMDRYEAAEVDMAEQAANRVHDGGSTSRARPATVEARPLKAVEFLPPRRVARTNTPSPGNAVLSDSNGPGYDGWLMPAAIGQRIALIVHQAKGVMTGPALVLLVEMS